MSDLVSTCVVCGAVTDAFLCGSERSGTGCLGELLRQLGDCAALVDELNTTISRQDKIGGSSAGFVTGDAEKPLPLNVSAMEAGLVLRDRLCSWVRLLWETNAPRDEDGAVPPPEVDPTIVSTSRWLMRHPSWIALHPAADDLYGELTEALYAARRAVDIPRDRRQFLGKCGFEMEGVACPQELYALPGQDEVTCKVCGSCWSAEERSAFLLGIAEDRDVTLASASMLLTRLGFEVGEKDLRKVVRTKKVEPTSVDLHGKRTYRLGDIFGAVLQSAGPLERAEAA